MDIKESLRKLGLTKYEIAAYLCILKWGIAEANVIYKESKVPFGKIYEILGLLIQKKLIEVQNTRPKKYRAIKPIIAFAALYNDKKEDMAKKLEETKEILLRLGEELKHKQGKISNDKSFWRIAFKDEIPKYITKSFTNVEKEINIMLHSSQKHLEDKRSFSKEFPALLENIDKLLSRDVIVRTIQPYSDLNIIKDFDKSSIPSYMIKYIKFIKKRMQTQFIVIDSEIVLLLIKDPINPDKNLAIVNLWDPHLAKDLNKKFMEMWNKSKYLLKNE